VEFVKHHVVSSGNSSISGYFGSDAVDFDPFPPLSPPLTPDSLRANIMKQKAKVIYDLAEGATGDAEEDEIWNRMKTTQNSYELIRMFNAIGKWEGLDDELPEGHLDDIARQIAQVLDQRDYEVYQLIRRYLILLDYNASPTLGDCFAKLLTWPVQFQAAEFDKILLRKGELLKGIASATLRDRRNMMSAANIDPQVIRDYVQAAPPKVNDLVALMHEVRYTDRICRNLQRLHYLPLYVVITEMVDPNPNITNLQRIACRDTCKRLQLEFAAARDAVEVAGSSEAKATINRFMEALDAALDNFPATVPAPTAVQAIATAIGAVANTVADLLSAINQLPDILTTAITIPALLDSNGDDLARQLVSKLQAQQTLARLSWDIKLKMINALLSGWTVDDDENAINAIMRAAHDYDLAEVYQLAAAATWESLYSSVDGEQYDELEDTLNELA
jgi:hypothetical protein